MRDPRAAKVAASGMERMTRAAHATSEAGPAIAAASAGSVMTPVPSTAPTERAVPWATVSVPCGDAVPPGTTRACPANENVEVVGAELRVVVLIPSIVASGWTGRQGHFCATTMVHP
jgi:hypothetical protein